MRVIHLIEMQRRWIVRLAGLAALAGLLAAFAPSLSAQGFPDPPHWFWGNGFNAYAGDTIRALDPDGEAIDDGSATINRNGEWSITVSSEDHTKVTFELDADDGVRSTGEYDVQSASLTQILLTDFAAPAITEEPLEGETPPTLTVRIIARRAPDGRVEFGMRPPTGDDIFPSARYFPATGPDHNRWLRSSEIDFGDGFVGRIIARRAPDGRVEFGFRVAGYDDMFPSARYFPATGPDHNRWLRSSEIEIGQPQ